MSMTVLNENYVLANGVEIPKLGFGTWQMENTEETYRAVKFALQNGYRHVDTARAYGNEEMVGKAVRDCGLPREQVFVTSKLPAEIKTYQGALDSFEETMENLGLDTLDLYLIHAPWPWEDKGADYHEADKEVWRAFEKIYQSGRCRAIGVSNFDSSYLESIFSMCKVKPMANQIRFFVGNTQKETVDCCRENGILVEANSPLATGRLLENKELLAVAERCGVTLPQLCIRYALQCGTLPLPKSTHKEYILQNASLDFEISPQDMAYLDSLTASV